MANPRPFRTTRHALFAAFAVLATVAACESDPIGGGRLEGLSCDLDVRFLADGGVGRDGIPAVSNPVFVPPTPVTASNRYVGEDDRVIAAWVDNEWLVIPHAIMYQHEIVNLSEVVVSYCPLTGTALGFSRASVGGAELGVSGLLYQANLILYDRNSPDESLWPQMFAEARCGTRSGQALDRVPLVETRYGEWIAQHPESRVMAIVPGMFNEAQYLTSPYGSNYENPSNGDFLGFPMPEADTRLLPKDRVLGIPDAPGGPLAFSFRDMRSVGQFGAFAFVYQGQPAVVLWDDEAEAAAAYIALVNGEATTFSVTPEGIVDDNTGTLWSVGGAPLSGDLAGCGPCRMMAPILDEVAIEFEERGVRLIKVDVDQAQRTAERFGIRSIPTLIFFEDGEPLFEMVGLVPKPVLTREIEAVLAGEGDAHGEQE